LWEAHFALPRAKGLSVCDTSDEGVLSTYLISELPLGSEIIGLRRGWPVGALAASFQRRDEAADQATATSVQVLSPCVLCAAIKVRIASALADLAVCLCGFRVLGRSPNQLQGECRL
jgi:hypothetical protein